MKFYAAHFIPCVHDVFLIQKLMSCTVFGFDTDNFRIIPNLNSSERCEISICVWFVRDLVCQLVSEGAIIAPALWKHQISTCKCLNWNIKHPHLQNNIRLAKLCQKCEKWHLFLTHTLFVNFLLGLSQDNLVSHSEKATNDSSPLVNLMKNLEAGI